MIDVQSQLYSLSDLTNESPAWQFTVPIYQRLYVWGDDQVQTLLNDLINAFERKAPLFFLGGTLLVEQPSDKTGRRFDLIDGQQRFTTLWLLCSAWGKALRPFLTVTSEQGDSIPRLRFAIRPAVNQLLQSLAKGVDPNNLPDEAGAERLGNAISQMYSVFAKRGEAEDWEGLTRFVFEQVKFVVTTVPRTTDLNKLFEVINNRGVQLQHHEILKARMLEKLGDAERGSYAVLWDACSDMEQYVERTLSALSGLQAYVVCEKLYDIGLMADADEVRGLLGSRSGQSGSGGAQTLAEILGSAVERQVEESTTQQDEIGGGTRVRSIISFPLLLQHALRIWLFERGLPDLPRVLDRELLALFDAHFFKVSTPEKTAERKIGSFVDLLWRLRVLFDEHVIKWVDQGRDEVHLISAISVSTSKGHSYVNRSTEGDAHGGLALLQSMLYHSQEITTHYWLTPFLLHVHQNASDKADRHFRYLQHLDNHLLCSAPTENLAPRTRSFMKDPWQVRPMAYQDSLRRGDGVRFAHYWFYKLEFLLWFKKLRNDEGWRSFRLTAKNSVEHISPQTPSQHDDNRVSDATLDHFGNLALVSRSINSEYGNLPFNEKRQRFLNKNKQVLDSLKMALIYEQATWGDDQAREHQEEMLKCLDEYILTCDKQRPSTPK